MVPDASVYGTHSFRSGELPKLPIAVWASEFFRGTGGGRVFRPRMAMQRTISLLGFSL